MILALSTEGLGTGTMYGWTEPCTGGPEPCTGGPEPCTGGQAHFHVFLVEEKITQTFCSDFQTRF